MQGACAGKATNAGSTKNEGTREGGTGDNKGSSSVQFDSVSGCSFHELTTSVEPACSGG